MDGLRKEGVNFVHFDSGDLFFKSFYPWKEDRPQMRLKSTYILKGCNELGLDVFVPGELDFTEGRDFLINKLLAKANFTVLGGNTFDGLDKTKQLFESSTVIERGGVKILVIGVCNWDYNVNKSKQKVSFKDPLKTVKSALAQKDESIDLVVVVSHLGFEKDEKLAADVPEIDVICGGHTAHQLSKPKIVGKTLIVQAYKLGKYLGRLDLTLKKGEDKKWKNLIVPLKKEIGDDEKIASFQTEYREKIIALHSKPRQGKKADRKQVFWFSRLCGHCHKEQYRFWKNTDHAKAMATLEKENAHYDYECIGCHTIGFRKQGGFRVANEMDDFKNVQCEACHGPGSDHSDDVYMTRPRQKKTCLRCHDEEHDPDFNYNIALPQVMCPKREVKE